MSYVIIQQFIDNFNLDKYNREEKILMSSN